MPLLSSIDKYKDYMGESPRPDDFDQFWRESLKDLEENTKSGYILEKREFLEKGIEQFDLFFEGTFGAKIHCLYIRPKEIKNKIPGIVFFHGYGSSTKGPFEYLPYVYNDIAILAMDVRGQGGYSTDPWYGNGPSYYGQYIRGLDDDDLNKLFARNIYLDGVKAVKTLMSMDEVDETRIGINGKSQGGALTIASSALVGGVKLITPTYPFMSDIKHTIKEDLLDITQFNEFNEYFRRHDPKHEKEDEVFRKLSYVDIQNFADKITAKVHWTLAFKDENCHPSTQFATYNKIKSEKEMVIYPDYGHEPQLLFQDNDLFQFYLKNL